MADQQTVEDLGKKVKVKYPGSYDDIPDAELGARVKTKHPEYSDFADMPGSGSMPNLRGTPVGGIEGAAPIAGRFAAEQLPAAGAAIGSAIEPGGGTVIGAGLGSVAKRMLRSSFPKTFGEQAEDLPSAGGEVAKDMALQGATEGALNLANTGAKGIAVKLAASRYGRMFPAVQDAVKASVGKEIGAMAGSDSDAMAEAANNAYQKNYGKFTVEPKDSVGEGLKTLSSEVPRTIEPGGQRTLFSTPASDEFKTQNVKDLTKKTLSDVSHVQNFKVATGEPYTVERLALNKAIGKGSSADGTIDPDKILEEMHGDNSDIYKEAITPETRGTLGQLLTQMKDAKANPSVDKLLNMSPQGKLFFSSAGAYAGSRLGGEAGAIAGELATGGVLGGAMLSNAMFKKLLSNPETAKLMIQAMKTKAGTQEADLIQKALTAATRGAVAGAQTPDK